MAAKPRLLDLYCGAGGAAYGYRLAGFHVVGVDIAPQPNYCGDEFYEMDAITFMRACFNEGWLVGREGIFDAIHASPPCQFATDYKRTGNVRESPNLIPDTREQLVASGLPYVIENVEKAAPWLNRWVRLCGSMFEEEGGTRDIERHRLFETNWPQEWALDLRCQHWRWAPDRFPGGRSVERTGSSRGLVRATMEIGSWDIPVADQKRAMGIDWMTLEELSESIPPAYTERIGRALRAYLTARAA